ncbi:MAG: hypothetical protein R2729_21840 [Bryobacteraceae bacterium]
MDRADNPVFRFAALALALPTFALWAASFAELADVASGVWWSVARFARLERLEPVVRWTSPDGGASLEKGDRVVSINGQPYGIDSWARLFRQATPGSHATIEVLRDGRLRTVTADFRFSPIQTVISAILVLAVPAFCIPILILAPGRFFGPQGLIRAVCAASLSAHLLSVEPGLFSDWNGPSRTALWTWFAAMASIGPVSWWHVTLAWLGPVRLHPRAERWMMRAASLLGIMGAVLMMIEGFGRPDAVPPLGALAAEAVRGRLMDATWLAFLAVGLTARSDRPERPARVIAVADPPPTVG